MAKAKETGISKLSYVNTVALAVAIIVALYIFSVINNPSNADTVNCQLTPTVRLTMEARFPTSQLEKVYQDTSRLTCLSAASDDIPNAQIELLDGSKDSLLQMPVTLDINQTISETSNRSKPASAILDTKGSTIFTVDLPEDVVTKAKTMRLTLTEPETAIAADESQAVEPDAKPINLDPSEDAALPTTEIKKGTVLETNL